MHPKTSRVLRPRALWFLGLLLIPGVASAQFPGLTLPPSGDNQHASVSQWIGPVKVTIDYSSPDVHAPNGEDRRGKIWGQLVPYGLTDLGFGTCKACPWRAGANENTVLTVSHPVEIGGKPLPAGSYGLSMIAGPGDWTVILSKNFTSWGSFFYDPSEDALRFTVTPKKSPYREWLTYEFVDRQPDHATVEMQWEELAVPMTLSVPKISEVYYAALAEEMRNAPGFNWQAVTTATQYLLSQKIHPETALAWAQMAVSGVFVGQENFTTLSVLSMAQAANGQSEAAEATLAKAVQHPTATAIDIHGYARQLLAAGKKQQALATFEMNAKRNPNEWVVEVGLARGLSAMGRYKEALVHAKKALEKVPDAGNRAVLTSAIAKLEQGQDMNP